MATKTEAQLRAEAQAIKIETLAGANTAARVGGHLENMVDTSFYQDGVLITAVALNTAKTGITTDQANAIIANTAKVTFDSTASTKVTYISVTQAVNLDTMESKLATIENNAKDDQTGAEIKIAYETENNTNAFTDAEKSKLASVNDQEGAPVADTTALAALASAGLGEYERRFVVAEEQDFRYLPDDVGPADADTIAPDDQTGGTGFWIRTPITSETASSIKIKYESNADTNAFTDSEKAAVASNTAKTGITAGQASAITANTAKPAYIKTASWTWSQGVDVGGTHLDFTISGASAGEINSVASSSFFVGGGIQDGNLSVQTNTVTNDTIRIAAVAGDASAADKVILKYQT